MIDYQTFVSQQTTGLEGQYPQVSEIYEYLRESGVRFPQWVRFCHVGDSVSGRPLGCVTVSDFSVSGEEKNHVVFSGAEHGQERNAAVVLLQLMAWLLSGTEDSRELLQHTEITLFPVVNADGYEAVAFPNRNHVNLFTDYSFDQLPTQPETQALARVLEESQPELFVSVHGHSLDETKVRLTESTGVAFTTRTSRCHHRALLERVVQAAEQKGYPQDRGEEDSQRLLAALPKAPYHSFDSFDREEESCTSAVWAYHRFHSLAMSMEVNYIASGVLRLKEFLRCGLANWEDGEESGYPVWHLARADHLFLTPDGATLAERRQNRVQLWQGIESVTMFQGCPTLKEWIIGGVGLGYPAMRALHELSSQPYRTAPPASALLAFLGRAYPDFETSSVAYHIEPCALRNLQSEDAGPKVTSVRLVYRLQAGETVECLEVNGESAEPSVLAGKNWNWVRFSVPLKATRPIGDFWLHIKDTQ
ncbi:MAG: hypothetical protein IJJ33_20165 [Victivallales bacterium]|nr:hypothetical protein [Victivallales bacterium]